jgi:hypothetical protein
LALLAVVDAVAESHDPRWEALSTRWVQLARQTGVLPVLHNFGLVELIEAAVGTGNAERAADALEGSRRSSPAPRRARPATQRPRDVHREGLEGFAERAA